MTEAVTKTIAFLGLGAMGRRMAVHLVRAGHRLTVWNRSPGAETALAEAGAATAQTSREAAAGADIVIAMLRDDEASRQVWCDPDKGALAGMAPGAVAIECSTLTPQWIRTLGADAQQHGVALLEAPVSGTRPHAEAAQLVFLAGGDAVTLNAVEPVLSLMGASIQHTGPLGTGALVKLSTNALLGVQVTALAEIIAMLQRTGADPEQALRAVAATPPWSPAANYVSASMLSGNFAPLFPVDMMDKDFGYVLGLAGDPASAPTIAAAQGVFREAMARGLGALNMTGVLRLYDNTGEARHSG